MLNLLVHTVNARILKGQLLNIPKNAVIP